LAILAKVTANIVVKDGEKSFSGQSHKTFCVNLLTLFYKHVIIICLKVVKRSCLQKGMSKYTTKSLIRFIPGQVKGVTAVECLIIFLGLRKYTAP
jgi:hypothetical protein